MEVSFLPNEIVLQVGNQVLQHDLLQRKQSELWQISPSSQNSTILDLSRSSTSFSQLLASIIYSHIAINYDEEDDIGRLVFLFQLLRTLDRKMVRGAVHKLTLDFRQISVQGTVGLADLEDQWKTFSEYEEALQMLSTELSDFNSLLEELAEKLEGLHLKHFEWRGVWRLPPFFYNMLGGIESLESVALDWTSSGVPCAENGADGFWIDCPYPAEPLNELKHIKAAALGMGCRVVDHGRSNDLYDPELTHFPCPGLISWLKGKNSLRFLYLAAPILYYRKELLPCWVKLLSIIDDSHSNAGDGTILTNFGEFSRTSENKGEDEMIDQPFAEAAKSFRLLVQSKHQEEVKTNGASTLTPQDILDLIHSAPALSPWRPWFASSYDGDEQNLEQRRKEISILEDVVLRWNETVGEKADGGDMEKFSKKGYFLHRPESGNKFDR